MNYYKYSNEQLWEALRTIDASIAEAPTEQLESSREELIQFFEENVGYNPDNLCTDEASDIKKAFTLIKRKEMKQFLQDLENECTLNSLENQSPEC